MTGCLIQCFKLTLLGIQGFSISIPPVGHIVVLEGHLQRSKEKVLMMTYNFPHGSTSETREPSIQCQESLNAIPFRACYEELRRALL